MLGLRKLRTAICGAGPLAVRDRVARSASPAQAGPVNCRLIPSFSPETDLSTGPRRKSPFHPSRCVQTNDNSSRRSGPQENGLDDACWPPAGALALEEVRLGLIEA